MVTVARTRITVPPSPPRLRPRQRLLERLDLLERFSIGAVVAGPGYGKSTVVAQWVVARGKPCAWYALVESDDEPYRFVSHLVAAIAEVQSDAALQTLVKDGFNVAHWRSALDTALNVLAATSGVVVLDDVHHLQSEAVVEALAYFVRFLPATVRLVLTSRWVPSFPQWTGWVVRGLVDVVGASDLALTVAEVTELGHSEDILKLTGGWPMAVDFLALQPGKALPASREALQDLILSEVWQHLSPEEQDFLLQCSLQDVLTDQTAMLERLSQQGAFVRRWPDGSYRIHDVFRDFLKARIAKDPQRARQGHQTAAAALLARGAALDAVPHLVAAGDFDTATTTLEGLAPDLLARGRHQHFLHLLSLVPDLSPTLLLQSAHALRQSGQYEAALHRFREAAKAGDTAHLAQALAGQAQVYIDTVQPAAAADLLRQSYRLAPSAMLLNAIAENALNQGRAHAAARYRRMAQRLPSSGGTPQWEVRIWLRTGQLQTARTILRERVDTQEVERAATGHREDSLVLSYIAALEGETEEAERLARQGLDLAQKRGSQPTEAVAWMRLGHALQLKDDPAAVACYLRALDLTRQLGIERLQAEALMGQALLTGDTPGSYQAAVDGLSIAQRSGDTWMAAWLRLAAGVAGLRGGHPQGRTLMTQALDELRRVRDVFGVAVSQLWLAEGDGRTEAAHAAQAGYGFLLERRNLFGPPPRSHTVVAPGHLRVQCLGAFRVLRDGVPLAPKAWKREKAKELFLILVTRRNRLLQKEELMELLWPDATEQAANRDFRVALHAVSDALDPDRPKHALAGCLERQGTAYGFRAGDATTLDVDDFERVLDMAVRSSGAEAIRWRQKALELYGGDFLEEYPYYEWVEGERERLRSRFLEAGERLAREALAAGDDEAALQAAHALLAREKAWEAAWQIIIRVHVRQGRDFMARRAYEQCAEALREDLGVDPSPETKALLKV